MSSTAGGPPPQDAPYGALPQDHAPVPPPPGWYPDGSGALRWWDGRAWSFATASPRAADDRVWAVLSHLSFLVLPLVAVIVIRLTVGKRDAFVRHHATEALNAQILFGILWNVAGFTLMGVAISSTGSDPSAPPPLPVFVGFAVMTLAGLTTFASAVVGAIRAHAGVWWRYPLNLRLVRGAVRHAPEGQLPR